ncbi:MAG: DegV family protein [Clostridiales bacterium]|nr:DegV family protein [Clostridiales bacterium]
MKIAIVTDSTCDLGPAGEFLYQIDIVPLLVSFGNKVYKDCAELSSEEFFRMLSRSSLLPKTSQPAPVDFQTVFRRRLDENKDVIAILFSSAMSGTYQAAEMARNGFSAEERSRIHLIDSRQGAGALALLVLEACAMRDRGADAEEICEHICGLVPRVKLYAVLDTLRYLRLGGRISAAAAVTGGLLNIVPVISLEDGKIIAAAKIRKSPQSFRKWMRETINKNLPDTQYPIIYLHSNNLQQIAALQEEFKYLQSSEKTYRLSLGAVIGAHAGPGAYGIVYVTRQRDG